MKNKGLIYLSLLSLIWGSYFLMVEVAVQSFPPLLISTARLVLGSLVIIPVLWWRKLPLPPLGKIWISFIVIGIFEALLPAFFIAFSEETVSQALASILISTMPIFTVLIGYFWLHRPIGRKKAAAIFIGFLGVVLVLLPGARGGVEVAAIIGVLTLLLAAAGKAFAALYSHRVMEGVDPLQMSAGMMIATGLSSLPVTLLVVDFGQITPTPESVFALLGIGILGAGVAFILYYWLVKNEGPTYASLVRFIEPIVALFLGVLIGSSILKPLVFVGLALIFLCLAIMNGYLDGWLEKLNAGRNSP